MNAAQLTALYAVAVAEAVLLGRLLYLGFQKRNHYPFFAAFLAADLAQSLAASVIHLPLQGQGYLLFWVCSEAVVVALQTLTVKEVFSRIRASYPGIGWLGEEVIQWAFLAALVVATATLFIDVWRANWNWPVWSAGLVIRRALGSVLAFAVIALLLFIRWIPQPIAPNVHRHARILATYLTASALIYFLIAMRLLRSDIGTLTLLTISTACYACWIWAFREGEDTGPLRPEGSPDNGDLDAAFDKLRALADALSRLAARLFRYGPARPYFLQ